MVMCDYFAASDDDTALGALALGPDPDVFDVQPLKGVDPVVVLPRIESILTGCTYDEASDRPRSGEPLSSPDGAASFVVSVTDTLQAALASATPATLEKAVGPVSRIEELDGWGFGPDAAREALTLLSDLAARATPAGRRLYCWWSL